MKYMYQKFLDPDLYDNSKTARFIETVLEPEIDTASDNMMSTLIQNIMPTDDISSICNRLYEQAQMRIIETGSFSPTFYAFPDKDHQIKLVAPVPTTKKQAKNFLVTGKALGFLQAAQCTFFVTMQPVCEGKTASGPVTDSTPWGILVIGSSLRGNCFICFSEMIKRNNGVRFDIIDHKITREGKYPHRYSRFFYIRNEEEMTNMVAQMPKLLDRSSLTNKQCFVNFATTLKALDWFNYDS